MVSEILIIILAIAVAVAIIILFKRLAILVLNAITGLVTLILVNQFQLLSLLRGAEYQYQPRLDHRLHLRGYPGSNRPHPPRPCRATCLKDFFAPRAGRRKRSLHLIPV